MAWEGGSDLEEEIGALRTSKASEGESGRIPAGVCDESYHVSWRFLERTIDFDQLVGIGVYPSWNGDCYSGRRLHAWSTLRVVSSLPTVHLHPSVSPKALLLSTRLLGMMFALHHRPSGSPSVLRSPGLVPSQGTHPIVCSNSGATASGTA